jgi:hypothetical protein
VKVGGAARDMIPIGDCIEGVAIDVRQSSDAEQIGPLGERGQMHHLRDRAAPDYADAERFAHTVGELVNWGVGEFNARRCFNSPLDQFTNSPTSRCA